ncbi:MAG: DMT family transporter [Steroidobacteraceae bacterium]
MPRAGHAAPFLVLAIALVAVSFASIFARLADAGPLAIAAWRMGIAAMVVIPVALAVGTGTARAELRHAAIAAAAGLFLALHFATWIASLDYTSIARSVLLVSTAPIWVAIFLYASGHGAPAQRTVLALILAIGGVAIASIGVERGQGVMAGDLLAVAGAIAMAAYLLLSERAQSRLPFRPYLAIAYGSAAGFLWFAVLLTDTPAAGFTATTWWALAGMAVVSQLIGHSGYNWGLRHLSPLFVAVVLVGEPVLAALLGWWLLGERLDWQTAAGGLLILAGILLGASAARPLPVAVHTPAQ